MDCENKEFFVPGPPLRLHVNGNAVLHLRHRWNAAVWKPQDGSHDIYRATQQLQTHLPVTDAFIQVPLKGFCTTHNYGS